MKKKPTDLRKWKVLDQEIWSYTEPAAHVFVLRRAKPWGFTSLSMALRALRFFLDQLYIADGREPPMDYTCDPAAFRTFNPNDKRHDIYTRFEFTPKPGGQ